MSVNERSQNPARGNRLLILATIAVCFAATDTYVVVVALPDIMRGVGLSVDELQRGAPIISGFLLGYVAMLPLIGRIADLRGRQPVLIAGLALFAVGSFVTALALGLPGMVAGRVLQGVGAGALVPATLALVADLYPAERRAIPLGLVSAAQELGAVLGPLIGAAVLAVADWRAIFVLNLLLGVVLAAAIRTQAPRPLGRPSMVGLALIGASAGAAVLLMLRPSPIVSDLTWGQLYIPVVGMSDWATPLGLTTLGALVLFGAHCLGAARPLIDLRRWINDARQADLVGAIGVAISLGCLVIAFASTDPKTSLITATGGTLVTVSLVAAVAVIVHLRRTDQPLISPATFAARSAWGGVLISFFVGAALVAALVDVPLFARTTVSEDSQLGAALVLLRFLIALPLGAIAGGWLVNRFTPAWVSAAGMLAAAGGFVWMSAWTTDSLDHVVSTVPLVLAGLGFGLALAPINHAVLAAAPDTDHGVASAGIVVSRMIGMLIGISLLTALGLRRYYSEQADMPTATEVCHGLSRCDAFTDLIQAAGIAQEHTVFAGAAIAATIAAVLSLVLLGRAATPAD